LDILKGSEENELQGKRKEIKRCFVVNPFSIRFSSMSEELLKKIKDKLDVIIGLGDPVHLIRDMRRVSDCTRYAAVKSKGGFSVSHSISNIIFDEEGKIQEVTNERTIRNSENTVISKLLKTVNLVLEFLDDNLLVEVKLQMLIKKSLDIMMRWI